MKRKRCTLFLLLALCLSLLVSCGKKGNKTVTIDGVEVVFQENGTSFTYGLDTYKYSVSGDSVRVTYPNGVTVWRQYNDYGYVGGSDGDWGALDGYLSENQVFDLVCSPSQSDHTSGGYALIGLFCLAVGAFNCFATETSWYLSRGWQYKDAEPSDAALAWIKGSGALLIVVGVILLLAVLF